MTTTTKPEPDVEPIYDESGFTSGAGVPITKPKDGKS